MKIKIEEIPAVELEKLFDTQYCFRVCDKKENSDGVRNMTDLCAQFITDEIDIVVYDRRALECEKTHGKLVSFWNPHRGERGYFLKYSDMLANLNEAVNSERYARQLLFVWWDYERGILYDNEADSLMEYILFGQIVYG